MAATVAELVAEHVDRIANEAHQDWPVWIESATLAVHLERVVADSPAPADALAAINSADIYLAAATAAGSKPACAAFEDRLRRLAKIVVAKMGGDEAAGEEVASEVLERLVVGTEARAARLVDYSGRGSLSGWLRATLSRTYLNAKRKTKREVLVGDDAVLEALDDEHSDPALAHMKTQYRSEFAAAFESAIGTLTDRQRGVLRYRFVDGATVDTIAAVYSIHRATCHRWISDARAALAKATERELRVRLSVNNVELDAIRALIESQLELSLSRMFRG